MVIGESLLLRGFETRTCASLAEGVGGTSTGLGDWWRGWAQEEKGSTTAMNVSGILRSEKSRNRPF